MNKPYTVAAYYFPNYHVDPRNEATHGPGWTEWELVRRAEPRYPCHRQPRVPLWGYEDESDPQVMARKIDAAADHGVDVFLFDWYAYDDGCFLERGLEQGFMRAPNAGRLKFAIHWANHDWINIHPAKFGARPHAEARLDYPGAVTPASFERIAGYVIDTYFPHPSYWTIAGCPYVSFYDLNQLIRTFGGLAQTRAALDAFRKRTRAAGFSGLHLNAVVWNQTLLPGEELPSDPAATVKALGFDSFTSYVWVHHGVLDAFPETGYDAARDIYIAYWDAALASFDLPYFPNVTMGWDPSPRTVQSDRYRNVGYPFTPVLGNATPERFRAALEMTRARLETFDGPRIVTLNAWNEWTEGSYLEPDTEYGLAYLEAIRTVFG